MPAAERRFKRLYFTLLGRAVWSAYGWPEDPRDTDDETILRRLLALNLEQATTTKPAATG